jgi:hypothetical protein
MGCLRVAVVLPVALGFGAFLRPESGGSFGWLLLTMLLAWPFVGVLGLVLAVRQRGGRHAGWGLLMSVSSTALFALVALAILIFLTTYPGY